MSSSRSLPFRHLTRAHWQNLAVAALVLLYALQVVAELLWGNLFGNIGSDFAAFWSAGDISNRIGYGSVYDLDVMQQVQSGLVPLSTRLLGDARTIPVPFLPIFLLPLQLLALVPPALAFALWSLLNLCGTTLYLHRFIQRLGPGLAKVPTLLLCMVAVPVFLNMFLGQVNLWLMICVGEFLLALRDGREARAGAWLAGLLLKPQLLALVVPALLLQRRFRAVAAFVLGAVALIGASWLLAGSASMAALGRLWLGYAGGLPTNDIQLMMNWRMLGLHAEALLGGAPALIIVIAGSLITSAAALWLAVRRPQTPPVDPAILAVGLWAATASVAWHSHVHAAVVLIPPLLLFVLRRPERGPGVLAKWVFIPAAAFAARLALAALARGGLLPPDSYAWIDSLGAAAQLGVNLWLLVVAVRLAGFGSPSAQKAQATAS